MPVSACSLQPRSLVLSPRLQEHSRRPLQPVCRRGNSLLATSLPSSSPCRPLTACHRHLRPRLRQPTLTVLLRRLRTHLLAPLLTNHSKLRTLLLSRRAAREHMDPRRELVTVSLNRTSVHRRLLGMPRRQRCRHPGLSTLVAGTMSRWSQRLLLRADRHPVSPPSPPHSRTNKLVWHPRLKAPTLDRGALRHLPRPRPRLAKALLGWHRHLLALPRLATVVPRPQGLPRLLPQHTHLPLLPQGSLLG